MDGYSIWKARPVEDRNASTLRGRGLLAVSLRAERHKRNERAKKKKKPLDDVEHAERTVLWRESVEWGVERDADVVHFLSEDRGDVAE
jgi:hypothetical protein